MHHLALELVNLGLSEKEATVYLALLELSPAAVQDVAAKAGVNRTTTYLLIDALMKRGIVSTTTHGKKQLFVAEPPERLLTVLRLQRHELEEKERELLAAMPLFNALHNSRKEKPQIRYFEGADGLAMAREIIMEEEGEFVQILPIDDADANADLVKSRPDHLEKLTEGHVPMRTLLVMGTPDPNRVFYPYSQIRVVAASEFPIHAEMTVRGNSIILFAFQPSILSVIITSKAFADTVRALFEMAWRSREEKAPRQG